MGEFLTIPATCDFTDNLSVYIDELAKDRRTPLSTIKIYVPTRRAIRTLKEGFLRSSGGKPRILPIIQAIGDSDIEDMAFHITDTHDIPPAIDSTERQIILARLLEQAWQGEYNFTQALSIAGDLGRLIDQIHTQNLPLSNLETLLKDREFAEHWNLTLSFLNLLLADLWPTYLSATGKIDGGLHRRLSIEARTEFYRKNPPQNPVIIAGSTGSLPATRDFINAISQADQGIVILPALDQVMDDHTWLNVEPGHPQYLLKTLLDVCKVPRADVRPYTYTRENKARELFISEVMRPAEKTDAWGSLIDEGTKTMLTQALSGLSLAMASNEEQEARAIAIAMADIAADPDQSKTCALITPDRLLASRVQAQLKQWNIQCDDSAGQALPQTAIGRYALSILNSEIDGQIYPVAFLSALKSPYTGGGTLPNFRTQLRALERDVLRGVRPYGSIADLAKHTDRHHNAIAHIASLYTPLTDLGAQAHPLSSWVNAHITVMESIAATPDQNGASRLWFGFEGEALAGFFEKIQTYGDQVPYLTLRGYIDFIENLMMAEQTRPPYGTHPRLSILGQIEARMASADRIILGGLNEGTWPPESGFDAWMSRGMRADFGLPSLEQKTTLAGHDFASALGGQEVLITYSARKGGQPALPSRWIQRMETMLSAAGIAKSTWPHVSGHTYAHWAEQLHHHEDPQACARPRPNPVQDRRPKTFSVTDIEKWMRDPYMLYAKKILRLNALKNVDEDPSVADRGTLIHAAMESFTRAYPDALPDDALDHLLTIGRDLFDAEADLPDIQGLWWPRFEKAANWVIGYERNWRAGTDHVFAEEECALPITVNGDTYTLKGKADRIERRTGRDWAIIDYKTGGTAGASEVIAGLSNQLPLEGYILTQNGFGDITGAHADAVDLHYWSLSGTKAGGEAKPAQGTKKDAPSGIELAEQAGEGLKTLIAAFANDDQPYIASPDPTITKHDYNDYKHLERISEWSVMDGGED